MIADRIRQARLAAGLTLGALGEQVGVSHTAIQKYEKGLLTPSSTQLLKLARACGIVGGVLRSAVVAGHGRGLSWWVFCEGGAILHAYRAAAPGRRYAGGGGNSRFAGK